MKNLYLLPTDKPSRLLKNIQYNTFWLSTEFLHREIKRGVEELEYQNIYIISEEEIKEGDVVKIPCGVGKVKELFWKFGNDNPSYIVEDIFIYKLRYGQKEGELQINSFRYEDVKKIVITTDQDLIKDGVQEVDEEFLKWFVKNPSCKRVRVDKFISGKYYCVNPIISKEETKPKTILESLQEYFKNTPKEKVLEDWNEFQHLDNEGITVKEFLENQKQETLEEAAEKYSENWEEITGLDYENTVPSEINKLDFINGAKWQKEQNKNLYSEEDMIEFADFYYQYKELIKLNNWETIEVSKEDVFKKWFEQFKKEINGKSFRFK